MKTIFSIFISVSLLVILQACSNSEGKTNSAIKNPDAIPVKVLRLKTSDIQNKVLASGQFTTDDETFLSFKTGGVISRILVKEGDAIKKGQLLATLNLTEINAGVSQAKLALEKATRDYNRVSNLYRDSVATLEQFQNAKTGLDVAQEQFNAAQFNRSYSEIRALADGYVLRKLANEGQVISSGTNVFQTNGALKGKWSLKIAVADKEWGRLSINDKAVIETDASSERMTGFIARKSGGTDPLTGSFLIEITITGRVPATIASGMFGKATITPSKSVQGWSIPYDALLDGDAANGYVFVTNDDKTAIKTPVVVSEVGKDYVLVSAGLENANALIISGSAYLKDQSPISIQE